MDRKDVLGASERLDLAWRLDTFEHLPGNCPDLRRAYRMIKMPYIDRSVGLMISLLLLLM